MSHDQSGSFSNLSPLKRALLALEQSEAELESLRSSSNESIAVVGMACRFPGGAHDPAAYWDLLCQGKDAIIEIPPDRWDVEAFYDPHPAAIGKIASRWGGFLQGVDVSAFDAPFFRIAPREAVGIDPMHRLLLEVTWEALADAGQPTTALAGSSTGVFVGIMNSDYLHRALAVSDDPQVANAHLMSGTCASMASGRISFILGTRGPCVSVNTACSSSLTAIHLAALSLRAKECDLALAGGVSLILSPDLQKLTSQFGAASTDGRCRAFDASAAGTALGEGCGMVVLKRVSDARAQRDRILALLRGSAINHGGAATSLTAPNGIAQAEVIRRALHAAKVEPAEVGYLEAHGTGTSLGDPVEADAVGRTLGQGRTEDQPLIVGAVKTNIGHLAAAAGVAGFIKAVLVLRHGLVPPNLHFEKLNPNVTWNGAPVVIPRALTAWPASPSRRIAAVSAFGWSGANANIILEQAPEPERRFRNADVPSAGSGPELFPFSDRKRAALEERLRRLVDDLAAPGEEQPCSSRDLAYSASVRGDHGAHRLAAVAESLDELRELLLAHLRGEPRPGLAAGAAKSTGALAFIFSGQGAQWFGMGRELLQTTPIFRQALEACDRALRVPLGWSVLDRLLADAAADHLARIDVVQPLLFALQVALTHLWRAWGVRPDAVIGHSLGEVAAAHCAGALSLEDAALCVAERSRQLATQAGQGLMAQIEVGRREAEELIAPWPGALAVAAVNSRRATVISGDPDAITELLEALDARGIYNRPINADGAGHAPQLDPLLPRLRQALSALAPRECSLPFYSTVTGQPLSGAHLDADYWARNLREPVLFAPAVARMMDDGIDTFLEISPEPILLPSVLDLQHQSGRSGLSLASLRRGAPERRCLLGTLGELYVHGYEVCWPALHPDGGELVSLPPIVWQREPLWLPLPEPGQHPALAPGARGDDHPLLQASFEVPGQQLRVWECSLDIERLPFLRDHRVRGTAICPAAVMLEMARAAAERMFGSTPPVVLEEVVFEQPLVLLEGQTVGVQLSLLEVHDRLCSFRITSGQRPEASGGGRAVLYARGMASAQGERETPAVVPETHAALRSRCPEEAAGAAFYHQVAAAGAEYGDSFRCLETLWYGQDEALGLVRAPPPSLADRPYGLPPPLLDACFQVLAAVALGPTSRAHLALLLPRSVRRVVWHRSAAPTLFVHARRDLDQASSTEHIRGDLTVTSVEGEVILEVTGLEAQQEATSAVSKDVVEAELLHHLRWQPAEPQTTANLSLSGACWLLFSSRGELTTSIAEHLEAAGGQAVLVSRSPGGVRSGPRHYALDPGRPEDLERLLGELRASRLTIQAVVYAPGLDIPASTDQEGGLGPAQDCLLEVAHLVRGVTRTGLRPPPRFWLVTRGAQAVVSSDRISRPAAATLWGLTRTMALEHGELRCSCVDLGAQEIEIPRSGAEHREDRRLFDVIAADGPETQLALREPGTFALRLCHGPGQGPDSADHRRPRRVPGDHSYRLEMPPSGLLEELFLHAVERTTPGPEQIEVRVRAAGLNFNDLMKAMGVYPGDFGFWLGSECSGVVVRVGEDVPDLAPGDEVIALGSHAMASYLTTPAFMAVRKPPQLSFAEAAHLPLVFLTAQVALAEMARLGPGETLLLHSGAGGVGLAAVQIARRIGAEIIATAGSDRRRDYLRRLGIPHVLDSRSLEFAEQVLHLTAGRGVDVVLNSLTGEAMERSLSLVAPYGRFVEIGRKDIFTGTRLGLTPFQRNISYHSLDLFRYIAERPLQTRQMLTNLVAQFTAGELTPLPLTACPIDRAGEAFHQMAGAEHLGKIVLTVPEDTGEVEIQDRDRAGRVGPEGTVLITGGTGNLGMDLTEWLVERGVKHLVLVSRSGAGAASPERLRRLRATGTTIQVLRADVGDFAQAQRLFAQLAETMPPLQGVVHAAGVLDDAVVLNLEAAQLQRVLHAKAAGAWNLHRLTAEMPLEFFLLYSSAAALIGSPGQGSYAAANAYLDALAHHRRARGLVGSSINWGLLEKGAVQDAARQQRLVGLGIGPIRAAEATESLRWLFARGAVPAQLAIMRLDPRQFCEAFPATELPVLAEVFRDVTPGRQRQTEILNSLTAAAPSDRLPLLIAFVRKQVALVTRLDPDRIAAEQPLRNLGMDSLMTVDLRNRLEAGLGLTLPVSLVWNYPTLNALAQHLASQLETDQEPARKIEARAEPMPSNVPVEELSEEEAEALLAARLASRAKKR